jgi:hypothetical protein
VTDVKPPMTFWEFANEKMIQDFTEFIGSKTTCPEFPTTKNWALTMNIEPEKYELYRRKDSTNSQNGTVKGFQRADANKMSNPSSFMLTPTKLIMSYQNLTADKSGYFIVSYKK